MKKYLQPQILFFSKETQGFVYWTRFLIGWLGYEKELNLEIIFFAMSVKINPYVKTCTTFLLVAIQI